jgi:hypothetical protein
MLQLFAANLKLSHYDEQPKQCTRHSKEGTDRPENRGIVIRYHATARDVHVRPNCPEQLWAHPPSYLTGTRVSSESVVRLR